MEVCDDFSTVQVSVSWRLLKKTQHKFRVKTCEKNHRRGDAGPGPLQSGSSAALTLGYDRWTCIWHFSIKTTSPIIPGSITDPYHCACCGCDWETPSGRTHSRRRWPWERLIGEESLNRWWNAVVENRKVQMEQIQLNPSSDLQLLLVRTHVSTSLLKHGPVASPNIPTFVLECSGVFSTTSGLFPPEL